MGRRCPQDGAPGSRPAKPPGPGRRSCWVCFLSKQDSRPDPGILMQKLKYNDESCAAKTE